MNKLSEFLKYYQMKKQSVVDPVDKYFEEKDIYAKIENLETLIKTLGDASFDEEKLKVFLYELSEIKIGKFGTPYKDVTKKIKVIYELLDDVSLPREYICTLFNLHYPGIYEMCFEELKDKCIEYSMKKATKESLDEFKKYIKECIEKVRSIVLSDVKRIEELKNFYNPNFIEKIQDIMKSQTILYDDVISILPSREFIDDSIVEVPYFGYKINSAEDFVLARLSSIIDDEKYEEYDTDEHFILGASYSEAFPSTSFTKGEFEKELKKVKKIN